MDWDYIQSLSPDNIKEEDKDDLFNKVTWFDCDTETFDFKEIVALFKIGQEILKYKSIQVETLLSELDELAAMQGEEEAAKKLSNSDLHSIPSKKSGSLDYDDLERKYTNLKSKSRKVVKALEKVKSDCNDLKQKNKVLEQDRLHLQNELQQTNEHETSSDISEIVKDQRKELMDSVHQKNVHISKLLDDIENVEKDNIALREKLTIARDDLLDATSQLNLLTTELTTTKLLTNQLQESILSLKEENEALQSKEIDLIEEKKERELQIQLYSKEIDDRVIRWKQIIDDKNAEIRDLNSKQLPRDTHSKASSNSSICDAEIETNVLQKVLANREDQILGLKNVVQNAAAEMETTTLALVKLKLERDQFIRKSDELVLLTKDLKKQLKSAHSRCQELQENIVFAESVIETKDKEFKYLIEKIRVEGNIELADKLLNVRKYKIQIQSKEKQISELVRTANKLQNSVDQLEQENLVLRKRLGISEDDFVGTKSLKTDQLKFKKQAMLLAKEKELLVEEKLSHRIEIQKLTKSVSNLTDQIINLGEKPEDEEFIIESTKLESKIDTNMVDEKKYIKIVEENEALRKGLHEILNSVQESATTGELKSETLEQLLLALDAKHISGWYHPAMRIQAELHTLQGVNVELREQLKITKSELDKIRSNQLLITSENPEVIDNIEEQDNIKIIQYLNTHIYNILKNYESDEALSNEVLTKLEGYRNDFIVIQEQLKILYNQYSEEKEQWLNDSKDWDSLKKDQEEKLAILEEKFATISNLINPELDEKFKIQQTLKLAENLTIANRKYLYLKDEESKRLVEIQKLRKDFLNRTTVKENVAKDGEALVISSKSEFVLKLQQEFDVTVLNYRDVLEKYESCKDKHVQERNLLNLIIDAQKVEKQNVMDKLYESINKLNTFENSNCSTDKAIENLTKKLAQCEIKEINEKHRADHTNNLYELVKEQLKKSEDKFKDYQESTNEVKQQNLKLQEQLKNFEDKILYYVDVTLFNELENKYSDLLQKYSSVEKELFMIKTSLEEASVKLKKQELWSSSDEFEYLSLKHQIVDLQAVSDDKAIIGRLSADVVTARLSKAELQKKYEEVFEELEACKEEMKEFDEVLAKNKDRYENVIKGTNRKNQILEDIICHLRQQYYGNVPLTSHSKYVENLHSLSAEKYKVFELLQKTQAEQSLCLTLKEQLNKELENIAELKIVNSLEDKDKRSTIMNWYQEKNNLQLQEIKYKRQNDYLEVQLKQSMERISEQDLHILKLEEELLSAINTPPQENTTTITERSLSLERTDSFPSEIVAKVKVFKSQETQTYVDLAEKPDENYENNLNISLQRELTQTQSELESKDGTVQELKSKITELEMNVNMFRKQIGDKQSQITFYEKHILDLQAKKEAMISTSANDGNDVVDNQELLTLRSSLIECRASQQEKDKTILKLQTLLKKDRDEHSLAAARMQDELKRLQAVLTAQKNNDESNTSKMEDRPQRAVVEQYILQVHVLEKHTTDLHTTVSTLTSQLQASREEAVRWRSLANDRLEIMEQLNKELGDQHKEEIDSYKRDAEKWRQEVIGLQQLVNKHRDVVNEMKTELESQQLQEKDNRIHELTVKLRQQQNELRRRTDRPSEERKIDDQDIARDQLLKEHETLKRRFEQLMNRDRNGKEEIRLLKGQLMKRPILSARSDSSTSTKEQQQQRKIKTLEEELSILKEKLSEQNSVIDSHRIKVSEDFEKWNKQKFYQQMSDKLKNKLKVKESECEKLQETCSGFRILIERLEREKHNLESRVKNLKSQTGASVNVTRFEMLSLENAKLHNELETLNAKLTVQQHHSGGLGAAMLQERLEAQERKIAVMEMAAKGTLEVRSELERLQNSLATSQKSNLRLEAENLEIKLDMETNVARLKEHVAHLENYITVLKAENASAQHEVNSGGDNRLSVSATCSNDAKKITELERTVFVLKRIVDKLQAENKRLLNSSRPCSDRSEPSTDRLKRDYHASLQRIAELQEKLDKASRTPSDSEGKLISELTEVKEKLLQKTDLLDKVKILLHKAAAKEKALLQEVKSLKAMIPETSSITEEHQET